MKIGINCELDWKFEKLETENWVKELPNVFGEAIFDELLVLELVEAHENGEIAHVRSRFEVEHHVSPFGIRSPQKKATNFEEELGFRVPPSTFPIGNFGHWNNFLFFWF